MFPNTARALRGFPLLTLLAAGALISPATAETLLDCRASFAALRPVRDHDTSGPGAAAAGCRTRRGSVLHRRHGGVSDYTSFVTLKYGTFDPKGSADGGGFFGLRTGAEFDHRLTLSFNLDVYRRAFTEETEIAHDIDRNGNVISTRVTSLETSSTLVPLGVSLGLRLPGSRTLTPFVGIAVAYEILMNDVRDFELGIEDTNVYGGPGWQLFGGLMVPVTTGARLLGELWFNDAEVSRDVDEYVRGLPVREAIDVSGLGARLGVELHF